MWMMTIAFAQMRTQPGPANRVRMSGWMLLPKAMYPATDTAWREREDGEVVIRSGSQASAGLGGSGSRPGEHHGVDVDATQELRPLRTMYKEVMMSTDVLTALRMGLMTPTPGLHLIVFFKDGWGVWG